MFFYICITKVKQMIGIALICVFIIVFVALTSDQKDNK